MTRPLQYAAFAAGLAAIGWVGLGYVGAQPLALTITAVIGAFYLVGAFELHRFQQATAGLSRALDDLSSAPSSLAAWLAPLPASLHHAVRLRIEGQRVALPGPSLTPYLAGLLVLLGMLGSFLGMVVTLNGTGAALESASDLAAIRASLAAPVKGLGLAFGTSVAGVAASAMLGLVSALCRRDRSHVAQRLDERTATVLHVFSPAHRQAAQREESLKLQQQQAEAMPLLVDRLQAMMTALERQGEALNERLLAGQHDFHAKTSAAYDALAANVGRSLQDSLAEGARSAGATIRPVVEATMAGIAHEAGALNERIERSRQHAVEAQSGHLRSAIEQFTQGFEQRSAELLKSVDRSLAQRQADLAAQDQQRLAAWAASLQAMSQSLGDQWQQAGEQAARRQQDIATTLAKTTSDIAEQSQAQARETIAEVARLVEAAAEAPRAAAEVIVELRQKLSDSMQRDNEMLDERARILGTLDTLLTAINHASTEQRAAIDALVAGSAEVLQRVGSGFTEKVAAETGKLGEVGAQLTGSALEVASLGEAFGFAVQLFSESNDKLAAQLQRIEGALGKSLARSDEQLAYYVAQAREVIDLSLGSQKQIVEDLQQLARQRTAEASDA